MIGLLVLALFFGPYLLNPNAHAMAIGGDPYVIYYDMVYHICHGEGLTLSAMNYPWYELIFLTDNQAALSLVLNWIHNHLFPVCDYTLGIVHALVLFLWPLTAVFIYLIFRHFKIAYGYAFIAALLLCFLSPQLPRITGHFGIAYGLLLPASIYWYLKWYERPRIWTALLLLLALIFFFFNNPYLGLICSSLLILGGILRMLTKSGTFRDINEWIPVVLGLVPTILFLAVTKSLDSVVDRVATQWGFFVYSMKWKGLIYPGDSILGNLMASIINGKSLSIESQSNLGFVPIFLALSVLIYWLLKRKQIRFPGLRSPIVMLIIASVLLLLFSMNFPFYGAFQGWAEENLQPLMMFKASGRFAWPFFYLFGITVLTLFWKLILEKRMNSVPLKILIFLLILIWGYEDFRYMKTHLSDRLYENPFSIQKLDQVNQLLLDSEVLTNEYQAIYVVPIMQAWTDKMLTKLDWSTHFYGMRLSAATGIPLINAMLSRMSVSQTLMSMQMSSHPYIQRELLQFMDKDRPILLLRGAKETPLADGEQYLLSISEPIYISDKYSLYRLKPKDILPTIAPEELTIALDSLKSVDSFPVYLHEENIEFVHESFDTKSSDFIFYGDGALEIGDGFPLCWERDDIALKPGNYEISIWTKVDHYKYGLPKWWIIGYDEEGKELFRNGFSARDARDIQESWVRANRELNIPENLSKLQLKVESNQDFYNDELWILPANNKVIYTSDTSSKQILWNNYKIELK